MRKALYCLFMLLAGVLIQAGCGQQAEKPSPAPDALVQQQAAMKPLPRHSAAIALMETRPPIDENNTLYLFPHEHSDLPAHIADWLSERGYVIPQDIPQEFWEQDFPVNAIIGEFFQKDQTDLAVFCTNRKYNSHSYISGRKS